MGFDIEGIAPKTTEKTPLVEKIDKDWDQFYTLNEATKSKYFKEREEWMEKNPGVYFRNNVWWWRPLWNYVYNNCDSLTEEDFHKGCVNDGHTIDLDKALDIANALNELLESGHTAKFEKQYNEEMNSLEKVTCDICDGKGKRNYKGTLDADFETITEDIIKECNGCKGTGKKAQYATYYPFSEENVKRFAEFVKLSGGFQIF